MKNVFDLRFVIGAFFSIVGIILTIHGFLTGDERAHQINFACGIFFAVFGASFILLSLRKSVAEKIVSDDASTPDQVGN